MVLGTGLVAHGFRAFSDDQKNLIFASGVSNSSTREKSEFERERRLLAGAIAEHPDKTLVYFSTCSIFDPAMKQSPYVQHKLAMEELVSSHRSFHIFRISNLAGKTDNSHTVLNYFANHIRSGAYFLVWKMAYRNIIDLDDAVLVCSHIIQNNLFANLPVNVANPVNYSVPEIVAALEAVLGKKGHYDLTDKGGGPEIQTGQIGPLLDLLNLKFGADYLGKTIRKYYSNEDL